MDIIAYQKAMKTKPAIKKIKDRLGMEGTESGDKGVRGDYSTVKERLEELEKNAPDHILKKHVSDLEASTAINLNKHNLRVNSLLNQNKYKLKDMIFDDFADATGIDSAKSSNYVLDAAGKKIKQVDASLNSEVVTVSETIQEVPQKVAVSLAFNEQLTAIQNVDLSKGTFLNTELVDNKIKLKNRAYNQYYSSGSYETAVLDLGVNFKDIQKIEQIINSSGKIKSPIMTSANTPSPYSVTASSIHDNNISPPWYLFKDYDGATGGVFRSQIDVTAAWVKLDLGLGELISKYRIRSITSSSAWAKTNSPNSWVFEGSNDNVNWTALDKVTEQQVWSENEEREFTIKSPAKWRYYRLNISSIVGVQGSGVNCISFSRLVLVGTNEVLDNSFFTSTSQDGQSFSTYLPVNIDGTLASPSGRYLKIKVELSSDGEVKERLLSDFTEEERNTFQENDNILFDGAAKLKTEYSFDMNKDSSFTEEGILLRSSINKSVYKTIEKVEVK